MIKICSKCKDEKPSNEFWNDLHSPSGKHSSCISCHKENRKCKTYDKEITKLINQKYYQDNKESVKIIVKKYNYINKEKINEKNIY